MKTGSCLHTLTGHSDVVMCCAMFDGDSKAISGSDDKTLKVWLLPVAHVTSNKKRNPTKLGQVEGGGGRFLSADIDPVLHSLTIDSSEAEPSSNSSNNASTSGSKGGGGKVSSAAEL